MTFPQKIVLASGNQGKVREFTSLFAEYGVDVIAQKELGVEDVPETGTTFVENAIIKARHAAKVTGLPAIADDSGLVVDALGGAPGIYSARFAGEDATDSDNIDKLLLDLASSDNRKAHFFCTLVFMRHAGDPVPLVSQGKWEGEILDTREGDGGFGYDPVFKVPSHNCTAAQLDKTEKNRISHRGNALAILLASMRSTFA
ncbi:RdgB/HAM1 family non-canonical purine NTP pyrophosphatase [Alteromonas stellipolaris]|uniref:RdgB/HAM1 family non-canonical purine NTP pyrophosphatase n=1 Tax=Alteromonas stellipolaris TaxID=233316 RepID=UPI0026E2A969|nr:RdgB/HAM1 family non-canonical purine NTP pyrophosphatase [Alteromonas stellipolaris]MDO6537042.1 RdgB/HAM1 family non-canonical purine NTP pyrophosphatase [Alteromonas stellipolaris]MDP2536072.1 RdgB/HAM1 family non-canonical purine NTP pyrophosphatase [Alteromonas stellipolaris]MDP2595121.1 RdgB/HAM1 family non-canonical purine NTP pyrophosphatase [Alteromonas stellipolaris]